MALSAYLTLKGQKQGNIAGSVTQKGREGSILVHAYTNQIVSPRDLTSGLPTGKRLHNPVTIVKENDRSSPLLWNALTANENLTTWELRIWSPSPVAASGNPLEVQTYTIRLTNANIASIREVLPDTSNPDNARLPFREEITFTYQKIQWVWSDGNLTAQDDWEAPVA